MDVAVEVGFPVVGFRRLTSGSGSSQLGGSDRFSFLTVSLGSDEGGSDKRLSTDR